MVLGSPPSLDVLGEGHDSPLAPVLGRDLVTDRLANLPIEVDQDRVNGGDGPRPGGVKEAQHLLEVRLRWLIRTGSSEGGLP